MWELGRALVCVRLMQSEIRDPSNRGYYMGDVREMKMALILEAQDGEDFGYFVVAIWALGKALVRPLEMFRE